MSDYELSDQDIYINIWISTGAAFLSLLLCSSVLGLAYFVWARPNLRRMIDRVSFRLLLWSMAFEILYDVAYIAVEFYSLYSIAGGLCASGVYFMMSTMSVVNYMCTAIAVNLMLTITFGLNPVRLGLEKWYVGVSIFLGMFIPIAPAALGHFGYDPVLEVCWIQADTDEMRMRNFVLDLYLWQILSCFIASVSVIVALTTLFRQSRATSAALFAGNSLNHNVFGRSRRGKHFDTDTESGSGGGSEGDEKRVCVWTDRLKRIASRTTGTASDEGAIKKDKSSTLSQLEDKFLRIALQISCYPIALIIVNGIITVGDLYISKEGGVYSKAVYGLYCIYYFLYGGRGIVFAALAFWIDPCFRRGIQAAWKTRHDIDAPLPTLTLQPTMTDEAKQSFAEMLAASTPILAYEIKHAQRRQHQGEMKAGGGGGHGIGIGMSDGNGRSSTPSDRAMTDGEELELELDLAEVGESQDHLVLAPTLSSESDADSSHRLRTARAETGRADSAITLDMPQALTALAMESSQSQSALQPGGASSSSRSRYPAVCFSPRPHPSIMPSRSFAGVPSGHLPQEMTDDLDVVDMRQSPLTRPPPVLLPPTHLPPRLTGLGVRLVDNTPEEKLEPLDPDLPDEVEVERLRRRVMLDRAERKRAEKEEAIRAFFETKALL